MTSDKSTLKTISATVLQRQIGSVIRRVAINGEHLVVARGGFPILVMLPLTDYQALIGRKSFRAGERNTGTNVEKRVKKA